MWGLDFILGMNKMSKFIYDYLGIEDEEFVNIDLIKFQDVRVFVDPFKIAFLDDNSKLIRYEFIETTEKYFNNIVTLLNEGNLTSQIMGEIPEVNDLKLGYGKIGRGNAIGGVLIDNLIKSFNESEAFLSGLLTDLYDTNIFIENISFDRVSDWIARINYLGLYEYTIEAIAPYKDKFIFLEYKRVYFDKQILSWKTKTFKLPTYDGNPFLLVPKEIATNNKLVLRGSQDFINMGVIQKLQNDFRQYPMIEELATKYADGTPKKPTKKAIREFLNINDNNIKNLTTVLTSRLNLDNIKEFLQEAKKIYIERRISTKDN